MHAPGTARQNDSRSCHYSGIVTTLGACRRQAAEIARGRYCHLGTWLSPQQLPVVYHEAYNVSFLGVENLHVFDSKKFKKVVASLEQKRLLSKKQVKPTCV